MRFTKSVIACAFVEQLWACETKHAPPAPILRDDIPAEVDAGKTGDETVPDETVPDEATNPDQEASATTCVGAANKTCLPREVAQACGRIRPDGMYVTMFSVASLGSWSLLDLAQPKATPCTVHPAAIGSDGTLLGGLGEALSPGVLKWTEAGRWQIVSSEPKPVLTAEQCVLARKIVAFPDRPGAIVDCSPASPVRYLDNQGQAVKVPALQDAFLWAAGRDSTTLWFERATSWGHIVVARDSDELGRFEVPDDFRLVAARADGTGFMVAMLDDMTQRDLRLYFVSHEGKPTRDWVAYNNPYRLSFHFQMALAPSGQLYVSHGSENEARIERFDLDGSLPVEVIRVTPRDEIPPFAVFAPDGFGVFVTNN